MKATDLNHLDFSEFELDILNGILYRNGKQCGHKAANNYYIMRVGNGKRAKLHRVIYMFLYNSIPDGYVIDHINNNSLDNRPWNLRAVTNRENVVKEKKSKTGYHNIYLSKNRYFVSVKDKGPQKRFKNLEDAIKYRDYLLAL